MELATGFAELTLDAKVLRSYFQLDTSAEGSSPSCKITKFKVGDIAGLEIKNDALVITEALLASKETEVELTATTMGLESAKKSLKLVKDSTEA